MSSDNQHSNVLSSYKPQLMETDFFSQEELEKILYELPPSAKLVLKTLQYEGDLTQQELVEQTLLAPRTVRYAIDRLEEIDLITSQVNFADARQEIYSLTVDPQTEDIELSLK